MSPSDYDKISPTAKLVAEMRRHSDIPFAAPVAAHIDTSHIFETILGGQKPAPELIQFFGPYAESRYKSLRQGILRAKVSQVIELASGFSFRGAAMTEDPKLLYIETDLPEMHETRTRLRKQMENEGSLPGRENLLFEPMDVMRAEDWQRIEAKLRPGEPVAVVHEGLLQYFNHEEKAEVAMHIGRLLKKHGGVWLTPDLEPARGLDPNSPIHPQYAQFVAGISASTSRNLAENAFTSQEEAEAFFRKLGFHVEIRAQVDGSFCLSSANRLNTTARQNDAIKQLRLWELTAI